MEAFVFLPLWSAPKQPRASKCSCVRKVMKSNLAMAAVHEGSTQPIQTRREFVHWMASVAATTIMLDPQSSSAASTCGASFYDQTSKKNGEQVPLKKYDGRVSLVVNVASYCALTGQYEGLVDLYNRLESKGLSIICYPCNQFGNQEPDSNQQICDFAKEKFGAKFDIMDKINVNGPSTDPVYVFLKNNNPQSKTDIEWNFGKMLVDKNGCVVRRYKPSTQPHSLETDIVALLEDKPLPMRRKEPAIRSF